MPLEKKERTEARRRYNETHKEKQAEYQRRYYEAHKEKRAEARHRYDEANKLKCARGQIVTRASERRDCPSYQDCLTAAAIKNMRVVPCLGCEKGQRAFNAKKGWDIRDVRDVSLEDPCES